MTHPCVICETPAGASWQGRPICTGCIPAVMRAHLAQHKRLRAHWAEDGQTITTPDGQLLFTVERSWRWAQPAGKRAWATIWQATVRDPTDGGLYYGRGSGPGRSITLRPKAIPKRLRELLAKNGVDL